MNDERWTAIERLVDAALERAPDDRAVFLREACESDEALRREVESLLAHRSMAAGFLSTPAFAGGVLGATPLVGRRLGPYTIQISLGVGGMGEVYRAHDSALGRDVAIKILPAVFSRDPDRRARFDREARLLAALNHPHIGGIYGLEDLDGTPALILELVEGETLADRLAQGPIVLTEVLRIARQIAEALEMAHEKGIVHRDLKPANIKITPEGVVKVLDFGLAKSIDGAGWVLPAGPAASEEQDPTHTDHITQVDTRDGAILGTTAYMSPEQTRGKSVDKRTDIWAFGCVLYEMLSGRAAFAEATVPDTIAKILDREPDWRALPDATPPSVRRLLERCLEKDPKQRLRDIGDARIELDDRRYRDPRDLRVDLEPHVRPDQPDAHSASRRRTRGLAGAAVAVVAIAVVAIAGALAFAWWSAVPEAPSLSVALSRQLTFTGMAIQPDISRDGQFVAYWNRDRLLVQDVAGGEGIEVFQGTPLFSTRWAPGGSKLLVSTTTGVFIVPRLGGGVQRIAQTMFVTHPLWWRDESTIAGIGGPSRGIVAHRLTRADTDQGTPLCQVPDLSSWSGLDWSPARNAFLLISRDATGRGSIQTLRSDDCRITTVAEVDGTQILDGHWSPNGDAVYYLVNQPVGALMKVGVGAEGQALGSPILVRDGVMGRFSISSSNTLAYERQTSFSNISMVGPGDGGPSVRPVTEGTFANSTPAFSPDATRIAFIRQGNVHIASADGRLIERSTRSFTTATEVAWSPDGHSIAVLASEPVAGTIWIVDVDSGAARSFPVTEGGPIRFPRLYWAPADDILFLNEDVGLSLLDPASGEVRPVWANAGSDIPLQARPSPDHLRIVVRAERASGVTYDVYSLLHAGVSKYERSLLREPRPKGGEVIGWNDQWIYVRGATQRDILRIPAGGGEPVPVLTLPDSLTNVVDIRMSANGDQFLLTIRESLSDIWLVENFDPHLNIRR